MAITRRYTLGLDIATRTGWAVLDNTTRTLVDCGIIECDVKEHGLYALKHYGRDLASIIKKYRPTIVGIEDIYCRNRDTYKGLAIKHGALLYVITSILGKNVSIYYRQSSSVRSAIAVTSKTRDDIKRDVCDWASRLYNIKLTYDNNDDDKADAIAIAHVIMNEHYMEALESEHKSNGKCKADSRKKVSKKRQKRSNNRNARRNVSESSDGYRRKR